MRFDTGRGITRPLAELAEALRQDLDWIREHTRLGELAQRWEGRRRPESLLLRGDDLDAAKAWMAARKGGAPEITDGQRAFISASEDAEAKRVGNERAQLEREKAQVAQIKAAQLVTAAAQARTARLQRVTRWAFAAMGAVILIAGATVGYLQWDKARQLATQQEKLKEAEASVFAERLQNADLKKVLDRRQLELEHGLATLLAGLSWQRLRDEPDSALRLAAGGTRIDLALPSEITKASRVAVALSCAGLCASRWADETDA